MSSSIAFHLAYDISSYMLSNLYDVLLFVVDTRLTGGNSVFGFLAVVFLLILNFQQQ